MKKLGLIIIASFFIFNVSSTAIYNSDPKVFVTELVTAAINKLADKTIGDEEKRDFIKIIALENVDINALGLYTLGELRKSTDEANLKKYKTSFESYFLKSLTSRLTDYSANKFEVIGAERKSVSYTLVNSKIVGNEKQPEVKIDWRIYTKNPEKPLIRDLIVEGLSLARTQKEEFASIINSNDGKVEALLKNLSIFAKR